MISHGSWGENSLTACFLEEIENKINKTLYDDSRIWTWIKSVQNIAIN